VKQVKPVALPAAAAANICTLDGIRPHYVRFE
jgi:hypothetical protein